MKGEKIGSFWQVFRIPESLLVFFSGAIISAGINILTEVSIEEYNRIISAALMIVVSLLLVVWTIIVKPVEEAYDASKSLIVKESENNSKFGVGYWSDLLAKRPKRRAWLLVILISSVFLLAASIVILFVF